jgi:hypothetical protein
MKAAGWHFSICAILILSAAAQGHAPAKGSAPVANGETQPQNAGVGTTTTTPNSESSGVPVVPPVITIDAAHPATAYRNEKGGFDFDVIGEGFSTDSKLDNIYVIGQGEIIQSWADSKAACDRATPKPCLWYEVPDKLHIVGYKGEPYQGPLTLRVLTGTVQSSALKPLVLARMGPVSIRITAFALFSLLALIVYLLVRSGFKGNMMDGSRPNPIQALLLDSQTDTYSLSKFQLLLFSATFIFCYLYVFLCGWLVQWQFVLPDVPAKFSAILGMSAGTAIVAAGVTSARGTKGAGAIEPSLADFISAGGLVIPERFQYFIWTIIACFGFVVLLLSQDPAKVTVFPDLPSGLLYVMGVSAGGYLGGKLTRSPGPVIRNIASDAASRLLVVQGENLSNQGDYFVDGKKLPIIVNQPAGLIIFTSQQQASDRTFCSELRITIDTPIDITGPNHTFRIVNIDGQFADAAF